MNLLHFKIQFTVEKSAEQQGVGHAIITFMDYDAVDRCVMGWFTIFCEMCF